MSQQNEQQKTNARARKLRARINHSVGWDVTMSYSTVYRVTTKQDLDALLDNLEKLRLKRLVNVPTFMPDLDKARIRRYAVINGLQVDFDDTPNGRFFSDSDSVQGDFDRLFKQCKNISEMELYNEILGIEL